MRRILIVAPREPTAALRGDQLRVHHLARALARDHDVSVLAFGEREIDVPGLRVVRATPGGRMAANVDRRSPGRRGPAGALPLQVRLHLDQGLWRALARELRERPPDVLHVTTARMAPYLVAGPWHRHLDLIDALSRNMATRAAAERAPLRLLLRHEARLMERYEAAAVGRADSSSLVAAADRLAAPGLDGVAVVPNGVALDAFPFVPEPRRGAELVFFGNLGYFHNVAPAVHLAREVLPLVRQRVPDARLRLVGARPGAAIRRLDGLPGVEVVGPVPEMAAELHRATVAVVPMFTGSGMKNKLLESFAAGTPVVSNALGTEGIAGLRDGEQLLLAEGPDDLAAACVRLLEAGDERVRLARAARRLVEQRYSWDAAADRLRELYDGAPRAAGAPAVTA